MSNATVDVVALFTALTCEHGISHGADNVGCQSGDKYLYVFKGAPWSVRQGIVILQYVTAASRGAPTVSHSGRVRRQVFLAPLPGGRVCRPYTKPAAGRGGLPRAGRQPIPPRGLADAHARLPQRQELTGRPPRARHTLSPCKITVKTAHWR
ncbi:MAG: hypothetical protein J2P28_10245, partial [Actinobacteria bacterium]|nr:hypothetical protein [Actinomycetota bacterium]